MISLKQAEKLIKLARDSIESYFTKKPLVLNSYKEEFGEKQGVFVTLNKHGELRGCIGYPEPVLPLYQAVSEAARSAAFEDPRFPKLQESELEEITIELSVLTVPELIKVEKPEDYLKKIKIGEDGLIIRGVVCSGLLLPQVFTEHKSDVGQALKMTCYKAGLDTDAWKESDNVVYKFQAQIFAEEDGKIVEKKL